MSNNDRIDFNDLSSLIKDKGGVENQAEILVSKENIKLKTRLSRDEIADISTVYFMCELLGLQEIKGFVDNIVEFKVSENGKGRKEVVDVLKGASNNMAKMIGGMNGFGR